MAVPKPRKRSAPVQVVEKSFVADEDVDDLPYEPKAPF